MRTYYFDANFFIPATNKDDARLLQMIFSKIRGQIQPKITHLVKKEVKYSALQAIIHTYFKVKHVEETEEFKRFTSEAANNIGLSKATKEPADASLAYAAALDDAQQVVIVTNDEGFIDLKRLKQKMFRKVNIMEPTDFLRQIMLDVTENDFREKLRTLIVKYAEGFIKNLLGLEDFKRPIDRILKSLLTVQDYLKPIEDTEVRIESTDEKITSAQQDFQGIFEKYLSEKTLDIDEKESIKVVLKPLKKFHEYYKSAIENRGSHAVRHLYVMLPELLEELIEIEEQQADVLRKLVLKKVFSIRINETINAFKDCYFEKAFDHFRPLLESDWGFKMSLESKSVLKLLYGIFLVNVQDFEYLEFLFNKSFWKDNPEVQKILGLMLRIKDEKAEKMDELSDSYVKLMFELGVYYCNIGYDFGLKIFRALFKLESSRIKSFSWHVAFVKRYLLELRINDKDLESDQALLTKFEEFLPQLELENNTGKPVDKTKLLNKLQDISKSPYFYRQPFYLIKIEDNGEENIKIYGWNDNIHSVVLLNISRTIASHLENVRSLIIKQGKISSKNPPRGGLYKARLQIFLDNDCELDLQRFQMDLKN